MAKKNDVLERDEEGFVVLKRKDQKPAEKKQKRAHKKHPFRRGSWKDFLYTKIRKWKSSKYVDDFHFVKLENIVVYRKSKPKAILTRKKLTKSQLEKLQDKYDDCYILINSYDNVFVRLTLKSYMKLIEIDKIAISYKMEGIEDGYEDEKYPVYDLEQVIDNINDLMSWINYYRQLIAGVCEVQASCCNFTIFEFKVKTVVQMRDGTLKTYKGDFNEVMQDFDIRPFL